MKNRCACLDLDGILENPALAAHVSENIRYTVPGFGCDYHLCTFRDDLEFTQCVTCEEGRLKPNGVYMHFSGNAVWNMVCDSVIDSDSITPECYARPAGKADCRIPLRIICPDVLAELKPGCELYGQVAGFVANGTVQKDGTKGQNCVTQKDNHAVCLSGEITDVHERTFAFEDIVRDFYEIDVETDVGTISLVAMGKNLDAEPEIGDLICATAYVSMDVAIPPNYKRGRHYTEAEYPNLLGDSEERTYYDGCVRNQCNAVSVLLHAALHGDTNRFGRCCADEVRICDASSNEQKTSRWMVVQKLTEVLAEAHTAEYALCITSAAGDKLFLQGILVDKETYIAIDTDQEGLVERITILPAAAYSSDSDTEKYLLHILARALCFGEMHQLRSVLSWDCIYRSDFSGKRRYGLDDIIETLENVHSNLDETNQYRYEMVPAEMEICESDKSDLPGILSGKWCFRLWQGENETPVAIVFIRFNEKNRITNIRLSQSECLNLYGETETAVKEKENASRVDALLRYAFGEENTINEMRRKDIPVADEEGAYVWQKADRYILDWFGENGYRVDSVDLFEDCVGYGCTRKGEAYAVYVYAYGEKKTVALDGDYCAKLRDMPLSQNRTILIMYLHVTAENENAGKTTFSVGRYNTKEDNPEVWELGWIGKKSVFLFYPRKEMVDLGRRLIAAYNSKRLDILRTILEKGASLEQPDEHVTMNDAVYSSLSVYRKKHGVMKTAFVRFNDTVYSEVPYIDGFCYIHFTVNPQNKIDKLILEPLDEHYRELIVTDEVLTEHPIDTVPMLEKVEFLPHNDRSRFSMLLHFASGEIKRYDAPGEFENDDVVTWMDATFTDKIFRHGRIADPVCRDDAMFFRSYPQQHQGVEFINGTAISAVELYHNSYLVGRFHYHDGPEVFEYDSDGDFTVGNIRNFDPADPLYLLDKKNKIAVILPEQYQQTPVVYYPPCGGFSEGLVMVSTMGELDLQYHHNRRSCAGMWGWLDTDLNTVIEPQYVYALNFFGGRAIVCKGEWNVKEVNGESLYWCENEQWGVIDKQGMEVVPCKFDELYEIEDTDRLYIVHEGGWESGHYAVFDVQEQSVILELDFNFDPGYMFNECFVADGDILVFMNHLPGEGKDLLYAYALKEKQYVTYAEEYTERTYNGQSKVTVTRDGQEIIVF